MDAVTCKSNIDKFDSRQCAARNFARNLQKILFLNQMIIQTLALLTQRRLELTDSQIY